MSDSKEKETAAAADEKRKSSDRRDRERRAASRRTGPRRDSDETTEAASGLFVAVPADVPLNPAAETKPSVFRKVVLPPNS